MFVVIITPKNKDVVLDRNALDCFHHSAVGGKKQQIYLEVRNERIR